MMKKFLLLCLLSFIFFTTYAQNGSNDPLNKPSIWKKLIAQPNNQTLWESYLGKDVSEFTIEDSNNISRWQETLFTLQSGHAEVVVSSGIETTEEDEEVLREMQAADWKNLEEMVMETSSELESMRNNIEENFALLEDLYDELFEDAGLTYRFYSQQHPEGNYSKTRFIEEQENKLREAKMKELQAMKAKIKKN